MGAPTLIGVLATVIASTSAANYNLDNPYYNRRFFDQLDDFYMPARENFVAESDPALRRRMRFRNEICCGTYTDNNMIREDNIRKECYEQVFRSSDFLDSWNYFNSDAAAGVAQKLVCLQQCLWKKRGTLDDRYDRLTGRLRDRYREGRGRKEPNMNFPEVAVAKCLPLRNPDPASNWFGFGGRDCNRAYLDFQLLRLGGTTRELSITTVGFQQQMVSRN
ncbi:putative cytosol aminopeptidase [Frankliniella fusca]|uniref:Cytosol aminopeptidase n=1 Tax=Frankliniella fusca TaxID=407009 RepID=A0AAE1H6K8_9NEOP|nr:putative cytosol aminopeptidase [Frankliniella fusca]